MAVEGFWRGGSGGVVMWWICFGVDWSSGNFYGDFGCAGRTDPPKPGFGSGVNNNTPYM